MRTLRRLKFMSSPSLSDLGKREPAAAADERGTQQRRACANATWNSIHNGVIAVFQRKGLPDQELFSLNEGVRQLLKTELGSFFTEYLQNQLLTKGMVILRDKIRFYEGQKLLDSLAETWDFFFSDVLPMLQAIFYPVQGKEPSVRQLALLHFRNAITLSVKLEDALARAHARVPPAIVQMLLVLQGVHESRGVTEDYLRLETLVQKVVSPYLGTYGLHSSEGPFTHSCILEKRLLRRSRSGDVLAKNPVVRSKSYNTPLLNPVQEHEAEGAAAGGTSIRRHSVSEMTSCPEPQAFSDPPGQGPTGAFRSSPAPHSGPCPSRLYPTTQPPEQGLDLTRSSLPRSSPENLVDQILESVDSDSEGIFIDFGRGRGSGMSDLEGSGGRQSVV
ncbi:proline-rich protein 5 [Nomascus leucogenys]|uniref:proline-rich protein 5 n=1 Tax=Nomascus leucogenys TaxID=61853 RepID=UPI00020AF28D|nr:proline-rich protein 5 [Nomascus leucogenys]